jgi:hypothetical protein
VAEPSTINHSVHNTPRSHVIECTLIPFAPTPMLVASVCVCVCFVWPKKVSTTTHASEWQTLILCARLQFDRVRSEF